MESNSTDRPSSLYRKLAEWRISYLRWQNMHMSESVILIIIALFLGIFTGASAAVIKRFVKIINEVVMWGADADTPNIRFLIWPLAGILLTSIFQRYVVRGNVAQGTRIIRQDINAKKYRLDPLTIFNSVIGCSITMGCGASGGTEGPTALSGSAIASNIGRLFKLSDYWMRLMVAIGGGAGIAAIFKSPMGGVLFTLEVLQMQLTTISVIALIIACLFSSATALFLSDFTFDIFFVKQLPMDAHSLGWVSILGVFCGVYSVYYSYTKNKSQNLFMSVRNPWIGALVTGGVLSIFIFMFPALFGEGFGVLTRLVNGEDVSFTQYGILAARNGNIWLYIALVAILLLKGILVAASYSNGGVAGDFVPTFFAGAIAGYLFGVICDTWLGCTVPVWYFSLIGMGCVMAGTIHAPLMAIFILCETTNTYVYIFPYILAIFISYFTVKIITPRSWYSGTEHDDLLALSDSSAPSLKSRL